MLAAFKSHFSRSDLDATEQTIAESLSKIRIDPLLKFYESEKDRHEGIYQKLALENIAIKQFLDEGTPIDAALQIENLDEKLLEAKTNKEQFLLKATSVLEGKKNFIEMIKALHASLLTIKSDFLRYGEVRMKQAEYDRFQEFMKYLKDSKRIKPMIEDMISRVVITDAVSAASETSEAETVAEEGIQKLKAEKKATAKPKDASGEKTSLLSDFDSVTPYGATGSIYKA